jgi:hypothetical protein
MMNAIALGPEFVVDSDVNTEDLGVEEAPTPTAHLLPHAERANPDGVCRTHPGSKPTVRKAQIPSGRGKDREANAGS